MLGLVVSAAALASPTIQYLDASTHVSLVRKDDTARGSNRPANSGSRIAAREKLRGMAQNIMQPARDLLGAPSVPAIDSRVLRTAVVKRIDRVNACYEQALRTAPGLEGRLTTKIDVAPDGSVMRAIIANSTLNSDTVERCIATVAKHLVFPKDGRTTATRLAFSLDFRSTELRHEAQEAR